MTGEAAQATPRWTRDYVFDILREVGIHHIIGVPGTNEIPIIDGTSYPENESGTSSACTRTSRSERRWAPRA